MKIQSVVNEAVEQHPFEPITMRDTELRLRGAEKELHAYNHLLYHYRKKFEAFKNNPKLPPDEQVYTALTPVLNLVGRQSGNYMCVHDFSMIKSLRDPKGKTAPSFYVYIPRTATNEKFIAKINGIIRRTLALEEKHDECEDRVNRLSARLQTKKMKGKA